MKKILAVLLCTVLLAACLTGCDSSDPKNFRVGFIYKGTVGEEGLAYAHDLARRAVEAELGITTYYVENVPETEECLAQIEKLVKRGCKIIFTTDVAFMDYTVEMAEKYPEVQFVNFGGYKTADNLSVYNGRMYQASYLAGMAAGAATQTDKIGYTAPQAVPEVICGINAFALGARAVNPQAEITVKWTQTWHDTQVEKQGSEALLAAGCDVLAQHQNTSAGVASAERVGAWSVGYHSPMGGAAPKGYLTSPMWDLTAYYRSAVQDGLQGVFAGDAAVWLGLESGMVKLDAFGTAVAQETRDLIAEKENLLKTGQWDVFTGPITNSEGKTAVAEGEKLTDSELNTMNWFVQGVYIAE